MMLKELDYRITRIATSHRSNSSCPNGSKPLAFSDASSPQQANWFKNCSTTGAFAFWCSLDNPVRVTLVQEDESKVKTIETDPITAVTDKLPDT